MGMRRRTLIMAFAGAAAYPLLAAAQQKPMPVIGWLYGGSPPPPKTKSPASAAFRMGLSEIGYVDGKNVAIEFRFAEGHYDRLPALIADLVGRKVSIIMSVGAAAS